MARKKNDSTVSHYLASTGFIFPRTQEELENFEKLNGAVGPTVNEDAVDPARILARSKNFTYSNDQSEEIKNFNAEQLVIPDHL